MPIKTFNHDYIPIGIIGGFGQHPLPPITLPIGQKPPPIGKDTINVGSVEQIIGLVPLFICCSVNVCTDACASFEYLDAPTGCTKISISIGGTYYGHYTSCITDTALQLQNKIEALLGNAGFIVTVVDSGGLGVPSRIVTICAPIGSCQEYNGVVLSVSSDPDNIVNVQNFSGGTAPVLTASKECDCRDGLYIADTIANDQDFVLPVFADLTDIDSYKNDTNSWLINFPIGYNAITSGDFSLQKYTNGAWATVATLDDTTYCNIFNNNVINGRGTACINSNYQGVTILWRNVLSALGEGEYRLNVYGSFVEHHPFCVVSPPFCLKAWDCHATDGTVRFDADYTGGNFGSVTKQGQSWSLCCTTDTKGATQGIIWADSIRFFGFFGYETAQFQRDSIKYQTGIVTKIRDEAIKNFSFRSDKLPLWLHQRFYSYGLMADHLYVSDYNINNANYNLKHFYIVADGDYTPKYTTWSRYMKVIDIKFKEGQQYVFRDRCC